MTHTLPSQLFSGLMAKHLWVVISRYKWQSVQRAVMNGGVVVVVVVVVVTEVTEAVKIEAVVTIGAAVEMIEVVEMTEVVEEMIEVAVVEVVTGATIDVEALEAEMALVVVVEDEAELEIGGVIAAVITILPGAMLVIVAVSQNQLVQVKMTVVEEEDTAVVSAAVVTVEDTEAVVVIVVGVDTETQDQ